MRVPAQRELDTLVAQAFGITVLYCELRAAGFDRRLRGGVELRDFTWRQIGLNDAAADVIAECDRFHERVPAAVFHTEVEIVAGLGLERGIEELIAAAFRRRSVEKTLDNVRRAKSAAVRREQVHVIGDLVCTGQ